MRFCVLLLCCCVLVPLAVRAQGTPAPAQQTGAAPAAPAPAAPPADWRNTDGYRFPPLAKTVADMQNIAYAMTLRDYCSDRRVADAFVLGQLARFSKITGRAETCRTLLDY